MSGIEAGKPGGGEGGESAPPGTIYFEVGGRLWSMNADGSGKTALPTSVRGVPSNHVHGGAHWFLNRPGSFGPIHATRGDGSDDVELTSDWAGGAGGLRWGSDDSFVSFMSRDTGNPEFRLYRIAIAFDADGVPSAAGGPVAVAVSGLAELAESTHAWSPSGDRVAWRSIGDNLNVTNVATGATTSIASAAGSPGGGGGLAWSPDGARILFTNGQGIDTIDPSGANRRNIVQNRSPGRNVSVIAAAADWSPDSAAIAYTQYVFELQRYREYHRGRWVYEWVLADGDVYRTSADGSATQNLTSETNISLPSAIAWR